MDVNGFTPQPFYHRERILVPTEQETGWVYVLVCTDVI